MAKKIRLDFSKTEERSGWNTRQIPEGLHKMKIVSFQETEAGDGTKMLVYGLAPADARFKSRLFPFYCKLQQNQFWKLRDLLVAAGVTVPKKVVNIDPEAIIGKYIAAEVEDETGQYAGRSSVNATYGLDILDEDGAAGAGDDEGDDEDEEYDGDEEEADDDSEDEDEDDEEEEDEDEEEEDLTTLTLAELRKRAKGHGIDTAGLKKAELIESIEEAESEGEDDEDEDLDDEDLEDEDLDDEELYEDDEEEEEEPAPAPKTRRAAPAKATPAKRAPAAKAAPAKRTVQRRR
jgi:hypothetical protein